ncbi:MAG: ferritin-like domain-containing protein [Pseudomonadota bacterium]
MRINKDLERRRTYLPRLPSPPSHIAEDTGSMTPNPSLTHALALMLATSDPWEKATMARQLTVDWKAGCFSDPSISPENWPAPAGRERPPLAPPSAMAKRGLGSDAGRFALLHAVAHIELNAIDLAIDMLGRFTCEVPAAEQADFIADWLSVADDEARHFTMVSDRLQEMGGSYGDLPAHDGLWMAAIRTQEDFLGRLAIAPLVLEARGLDVTPPMIKGLTSAKDMKSAAILQQIHDEEVGHVSIGAKWFRATCSRNNVDPQETFSTKVEQYFPGGLKRPFNTDARDKSGVPRDWYEGAAIS